MSNVFELFEQKKRFESSDKIIYSFDDLIMSAINFIRIYEGQDFLDFYGKLEYTMAQACDVAEFLLENDTFRSFGDFKWDAGRERQAYITERFSLYDTTALNGVDALRKKEYGEELEPQEIVELIIDNYIEEFTDSFNLASKNGVFFLYKNDVRKNAFKKGDFDLVRLIDKSIKDPSLKLSFLGIKDDFDKTNAILYKPSIIKNASKSN